MSCYYCSHGQTYPHGPMQDDCGQFLLHVIPKISKTVFLLFVGIRLSQHYNRKSGDTTPKMHKHCQNAKQHVLTKIQARISVVTDGQQFFRSLRQQKFLLTHLKDLVFSD